MKNSRLLRVLGFVAVLLCFTMSAWSQQRYGKVTVNSNDSSRGSVYISTSNTATSGNTTESWNGLRWIADSKTYYLFAKPNDHYKFDRWSGSGSSTDNPYKVTLTASGNKNNPTNFNYTASFSQVKHYGKVVVETNDPNGLVFVDTKNDKLAGALINGSTQQEFDCGGVKSGDTKTFYLHTHDIADKRKLNRIEKIVNGEITTVYTRSGDTNVASAIANVQVSADAAGTQASPTVTTFRFVFDLMCYGEIGVTTNNGNGGSAYVSTSATVPGTETSITWNNGYDAAKKAKTVYLHAVPKSGYVFSGWTGDGTFSDNPQKLTVTAEGSKEDPTFKSYTANFSKLETYYSQLNVNVVGEGGTVLVSRTANSSGTYAATSTLGILSQSSTGSANHTYYVYNKPAQDYLFDGYYSDKDCTKPLTLSNGTYSIGATSNSSARPTIKTIYAKFKRIYTYSATVKVAGDGGTATVNGKAVDTQSETTDVVKTVNYSFKLEATPNTDYEFKGWARSLEGDIETTDNPYTRTITCTTSNLAQQEDWFAIFEQKSSQSNTTFTNPILDADALDPSVIIGQDGYAYMYCSEKTVGDGISVWRSADMLTWTKMTTIFGAGARPAAVNSGTAAANRLTAPEIAYVNGKYVLYYANVYGGEVKFKEHLLAGNITFNKSQICVATSDTPYGPFTNNKVLVSYDVNGSSKVGTECQDPSFFADGNNNYLVFGNKTGIYKVKLDANGTTVTSGLLDIIDRGLIHGIHDSDFTELTAPRLLKHNGVYYLMATKGDAVVVARARTALNDNGGSEFVNEHNGNCFGGLDFSSVTYELFKNRGYVSNPGHTSQFVVDMKGQAYVYYHGYAKNASGSFDYTTKKLFTDMIVWKVQGSANYEWPTIFDPEKENIPNTKPEVDEEPQIASSMQISNAEELLAFSNASRENPFITGVITADIDCSDLNWLPIGSIDKPFKGIINGQKHKIMNLTSQRGSEAALVAYADGGASFKNIIVHSSCSFASEWNNASAFVAYAKGSGGITFENCGNEAVVSSGFNAGGFVGKAEGAILIDIKNCYNLGDISVDISKNGNSAAAFVACSNSAGTIKFTNSWNNGSVNVIHTDWNVDNAFFVGNTTNNNVTVTNCYDLKNVLTSGTIKIGKPSGYNDAWIENGHLAFYINEKNSNKRVWYQKLGVDEHPMPFTNGGDLVYKAIGCDGKHATKGGYNEGGYTNSSRGASHVYEFVLTTSELSKKCKNCSNLYSSITVPRHSDGFLEVSNADQMELSMDFISAGRTVAIESGNEVGENEHGIDVNIRLMQDIDFRAKGTKYYGLANDGKRFVSVFDGQFHHVTVNYTTKYAYTGLFSGLHDATIKNLYLDGTITNEKYQYVGSLFGYANNSTIEKCLSSVSITDKSNITDNEVYIGGIGGRALAGTKIDNCGFVGNISSLNANNVSGIVELVSNVAVTITNSYVAAKINAKSVKDFAPELSKVTVTNCYSYAPDAEEVTGGKLCYDLNQGQTENVWKQTIGVQPYPEFKGDDVNWDESTDVYYNDVYMREGLKAGDYFTICLDRGVAQFEGGELYSIAGKRVKDGGEVSSLLLYGRDEMVAGEPYIVRATSDVFKACLTGKKASEPAMVNGLRGTFVDFPFNTWDEYDKENAADGVFVLTNNILKRASAKSGAKAYRAFLIMSKVEDKPELLQNAGVKLFNLDFEGMNDDVETSIEMTDVDFADMPVYNLQGQRVFKPSHGIFIVNGKKVFVK